MPEAEVTQAVEEVTQNGSIRGTKEYNKDEYIAGAAPATSSRLFPAWTDGGKIFYNVRTHALDPRNFKNDGGGRDPGAPSLPRGRGGKDTHLRSDAVLAGQFGHTAHECTRSSL